MCITIICHTKFEFDFHIRNLENQRFKPVFSVRNNLLSFHLRVMKMLVVILSGTQIYLKQRNVYFLAGRGKNTSHPCFRPWICFRWFTFIKDLFPSPIMYIVHCTLYTRHCQYWQIAQNWIKTGSRNMIFFLLKKVISIKRLIFLELR